MWIKDKNSSESYIHVCKGLTEKKMRAKKIEIRLHDISIFTLINLDKSVEMVSIKFCPYCGIELNDIV
jgi:hypothetical protein